MKRYRRPKTVEGEIKIQMGRVDGCEDLCIFYGDSVPRCDRALMLNALGGGRQRFDYIKKMPIFEPSLIEELRMRGYDIGTLRISIRKQTKRVSE